MRAGPLPPHPARQIDRVNPRAARFILGSFMRAMHSGTVADVNLIPLPG
jgi:hypothetical protein